MAQMPERVELGWAPPYLLMRGPYAFTRHPMYFAELALWLGWALFYGSVAVFIALLVLGAWVSFIVPREERALEAKFGDVYHAYQRESRAGSACPGAEPGSTPDRVSYRPNQPLQQTGAVGSIRNRSCL